MPNTRAETASLGAIEVPAEALYGAQTVGAVGNFPMRDYRRTFSNRSYPN
jgi:aspartate ammonia-lyase